jgi:hypothetical protein
MRGAITPFPQYVRMWWCLVKHRETLPLPYTLRDFSNLLLLVTVYLEKKFASA